MGEAKKFKSYEQRVGRINAFEEELEHYTDAELREAADELRERARDGETLDELLYESFALVARGRQADDGHAPLRRAADRRDGAPRRRDRRDEDRRGQDADRDARGGAQLARRARRARGDRQRLPGPARRAVDEADLRHARRQASGSCRTCSPTRRSATPTPPTSPTGRTPSSASTTCATTWPTTLEEKVQHGGRPKPEEGQSPYHTFAIVDEVDNILIDEARTPLIISGAPEQAADLYAKFARLAPQLQPGKTPEGMDPRMKKEFVADFDYEFEEKHKTVVGHRAAASPRPSASSGSTISTAPRTATWSTT